VNDVKTIAKTAIYILALLLGINLDDKYPRIIYIMSHFMNSRDLNILKFDNLQLVIKLMIKTLINREKKE